MKPWERQPHETPKAFSVFQRYLELGPDRTLKAAAKDAKVPDSRVKSWSTNHNWLDRAAAWEDYVAEATQKRTRRILERDSEKRAERVVKLREDEYDSAEKLIEKAREMMSFSLIEKTIVTETRMVGNEAIPVAITIIKPARWTMRDIPAFLESASKLMRISLELETSRDRLDINVHDEATRLKNARLTLDRVREEMIGVLSENSTDAERKEVMALLPELVAKQFDLKPEELLADEPPTKKEPKQLTEGESQPIEDLPDDLPPATLVDGMLIEEDVQPSSSLSQ